MRPDLVVEIETSFAGKQVMVAIIPTPIERRTAFGMLCERSFRASHANLLCSVLRQNGSNQATANEDP